MAELEEEIALLLSLVVEASGCTRDRQDRDYRRVLECYTSNYLPRRSRLDEKIVRDIDQAFNALQAQPLISRQGFVNHCAEIVNYDLSIVTEEKMMLALLAGALEVTVRPLANNATHVNRAA